jgi:hypothetical protein
MAQTKTTRPPARYQRLSRRYLAAFACTLLGCLSAIAALNLLVDPYGAYRLIKSPALDAAKPTTGNRITKAELARHENAEAIMLGSSRVEVGLDPCAPEWAGRRAINLGLTGSSQLEVASAFHLACKGRALRTAVYMVDMSAFDAMRRSNNEDFPKSRLNVDLPAWEYHIENLIGWDATNYSVNSLAAWMGISHRRPAGKLGLNVPDKLVALGFHPALRLELAHPEGAKKHARFRLSDPAVDSFRNILRVCRQRDIRLFLAVPPLHAIGLEEMWADGNSWDDFENWKRILVKVVAEENARTPQAEPVLLWDFSSYSGLCAEEVPPMKAANPHMRYFYDPGHFTPLLGGMLLRRMFAGPAAADADLSGLGVVLTPDTIESQLARIRAERDSYMLSHPAEVAEIHDAMK